jgi:putative tricarboxylic transport membrane protein
MDLLSNLALGFEVAISPSNLLYCFVGVTLGTFIGVLPGIGPLATISMLLPLTFGMEPIGALIMLAGIYYGSMYGSAVTSILLNTPGHAGSAVVCLDGYPMAKSGQGSTALVMSAIASFVGGTLAIVLVIGFAPWLAQFAVRFSAPEYFSMMILALLAAAGLAKGSLLKGLGMVLIGLAIGMVGTDLNSGTQRLTFGSWNLADGVNFIIVAMGFFAIAEVMSNLEQKEQPQLASARFRWRELVPPANILRQSLGSIFRGFGVGAIFGVLPGSGPTIATFVAYSVEKKLARDPSRFGKGAIEGVTGPEAANNAGSIAAFIPTLTLGVPGDAIMALMLGALMIFGIAPGPQFIAGNPELFWGLMASFWIGNVLLLVLNIPFIGVWVRVLSIPYNYLYISIILFICIGVFSLSNAIFDIFMLAGFGIAGYLLSKLDLPVAPLLLALILSPMIEENLRRALLMSRGELAIFVERPISLLLLSATFLIAAAFAYGGSKSQVAKPAGSDKDSSPDR